jgi:thioredoxin 1
MNVNQHEMPVAVSEANFDSEVLKAKEPVLVAFLASWSRPCNILDSVLAEVATTCASTLKVAKVNADDSLDLSLRYDIDSVPTLIHFVGGTPRARIVGTATKEAILAKFELLGAKA